MYFKTSFWFLPNSFNGHLLRKFLRGHRPSWVWVNSRALMRLKMLKFLRVMQMLYSIGKCNGESQVLI